MNSRTLTGSLLIIGPILAIMGFIGWAIVVGTDISPDDTQATIKAFGENVVGVKMVVLLFTLGSIAVVGGIRGIRNSMDGGSGFEIAGFGFFIMVIALAGNLAETAFVMGTAEASSKMAQAAAAGSAESAASAGAVAASLYSASQAIGAVTTALLFLGFGIIGYGVYMQKNFNAIIACLIVVIGIIGVVLPIIDYAQLWMIIPWVSFICMSIALGVISIRSNG